MAHLPSPLFCNGYNNILLVTALQVEFAYSTCIHLMNSLKEPIFCKIQKVPPRNTERPSLHQILTEPEGLLNFVLLLLYQEPDVHYLNHALF